MLKFKKLALAVFAGAFSLGSAAVPVNAESNNYAVTSNGQTVKLPASDETGDEKYSDVLGDAQYFGITANEWSFNGEAEANAAVKKFTHQGTSGGQTGLTDKAEGSIHGYSIIGSVDSPFMVKGVGETIITPESEKDKFTNSTSGKLDFDLKTEDEINAKIDDMRDYAEKEAKRMAELDSITDYSVIPFNQMTIDVTNAGKKTVYISADKVEGLRNMLKQSSGVTIKKNEGQVVVLNFDDEDVNINKLEIEQNGQKYGGDSLANVSTSKNKIAEEIVFNMPNAKKAELHNVTGIVLAPQATIDTYDVTGGWLVADIVINHCEHHFTNGVMPEKVDVFKKDTPKPTDEPQPTVEPTEEPETPQPTTEPTAEPVKPVEPEKPALKKAKFRVHAFRVRNNVAKPEESLKIDITKTDYNIPEEEQNKSDKEDTRTSEDIKVGDVVGLTTNNEGNIETELDKGTFKVEAKRANAPVVEKADQTVVYVHSDATLTGNAIEEDNKFTVRQVEETKPDEPTVEPTEEPETPQPTTEPTVTPDVPDSSDTLDNKPVTPQPTEQPEEKNYTVTFVTNEGTEVKPITSKEGSKVEISTIKTTRKGYTFEGWYLDKDFNESVDKVTLDKDYTVYAKWSKIPDEVAPEQSKPEQVTPEQPKAEQPKVVAKPVEKPVQAKSAPAAEDAKTGMPIDEKTFWGIIAIAAGSATFASVLTAILFKHKDDEAE